MSHYKTRQNLKRSAKCRRVEDRRNIPHPFGSREWIENIQNHYLAWPKVERREAKRRKDERRSVEQYPEPVSEIRHSEEKFSHLLLTQEERRMIQDLYLSEVN